MTTATLDAFASRPHYLEHIAPIWRAMPDKLRGELVVPDRLLPLCELQGLENARSVRQSPVGDRVLVAAAVDMNRRRRHSRIALLEHGAGQTYRGVDNAAYSGGRDRDSVELFLCPSETVAMRNLARYPDAAAAVVGCPKLDRWHLGTRGRDRSKLVVVSFHWDCGVTSEDPVETVPEAGSAFRHWLEYLPLLQEWVTTKGWGFAGHAHPRAHDVAAQWHHQKASIAPTWDEVLDLAAVYIVDNSSTMYEAAAVGIPVVALNAPWYRRDVEHGLRFWDTIPGPQAETPGELGTAIEEAIHTPGAWAPSRAAATRHVYTHHDGTATARAVEALLDWLEKP